MIFDLGASHEPFDYVRFAIANTALTQLAIWVTANSSSPDYR